MLKKWNFRCFISIKFKQFKKYMSTLWKWKLWTLWNDDVINGRLTFFRYKWSILMLVSHILNLFSCCIVIFSTNISSVYWSLFFIIYTKRKLFLFCSKYKISDILSIDWSQIKMACKHVDESENSQIFFVVLFERNSSKITVSPKTLIASSSCSKSNFSK